MNIPEKDKKPRKQQFHLRIGGELKQRITDMAAQEKRTLNSQIEYLLEQSVTDTSNLEIAEEDAGR